MFPPDGEPSRGQAFFSYGMALRSPGACKGEQGISTSGSWSGSLGLSWASTASALELGVPLVFRGLC